MKSTIVFLHMILGIIGYTQSLEQDLFGISENDEQPFFGEDLLLTQWEDKNEIWKDEKTIPEYDNPQVISKKHAEQYKDINFKLNNDKKHSIRKREVEHSIIPEEGSGGGDLEVVHGKEQNMPSEKDKLEVGMVTPQVNKTSEEKIILTAKPNVTTVTPTTKPISKPSEDKNKNTTNKPIETEKVTTIHDNIEAHVTRKPAETTRIENNGSSDLLSLGPAPKEIKDSTRGPLTSTTIITTLKSENATNESNKLYNKNGQSDAELLEANEEEKAKDAKKARKLEPLDKEQSALAALNDDVKTMEESEKALGSMQPNESLQASPEEPKTGKSSETSQPARTDSKLLIFLGVTVVTVGIAAFTYNFVKKLRQRRNQQEISQNGGTMQKEDPEAGRELRPLMKNGEKVAESDDTKVEIDNK